jgi:NADP-dependent 3-hydroxy acid dehydrogenase YdfG
MPTETITLQIPEIIYQRLVNTAHATQRPLEEVILHALQVGSPPAWDDVPEEFQAELAALDKLNDNALWRIFHSHKTVTDMEEYNSLLEKNSHGTLTETERLNLTSLRYKADLFMLRKAQSAVLLRWRGYSLPNL